MEIIHDQPDSRSPELAPRFPNKNECGWSL